MHVKIAPSILAADFTRLGEQIRDATAGGADYVHIDVMDGHFAPNLSMGPLVVEAARRTTDIPLDVHLMIEKPERYLADFAAAGADSLTVHVEACPQLHRTLQQISELGVGRGVALNPATPLGALEEVLELVDLILIMTVNPGFGGQVFIASMLPKLERLQEMLRARDVWPEVEVDGGIDVSTAPLVVQAGANVLVAGSSIFNDRAPVAENLAALRHSVEHSLTRAPTASRQA